jgi:ABC-type branched-subunit amino acid transport system ATPase component
VPSVAELQQVRGGGLRGIDLRVEPGEKVGVIGPPGSGASAVVPLVAGTAEPDAGRVVREGQDVTGRSMDDRPGGLGWVSRSPEPFASLTVYENVLVAALANRRWRHRLADAHARRALLRLGLGEVADLPASELDLEQRWRLEVARVVAAPRRLLLVDHLAETLGPAVRAELAGALAEAATDDHAVLWADAVDHPPPGVDRLVVLAQGRVVADGPRHDVVASQDLRSLQPRPGLASPTAQAPPADQEVLLEVTGWQWAGSSGPGRAPADLVVAQRELVLVTSLASHRADGLLRSLAGLVPGDGGLRLLGADLELRRTRARVASGLGLAPSTGGLDPGATVSELFALGRAGGRRGPWAGSALFALFPELVPLREEQVGRLAPLERRLASIGRALAGNPRVLLVEAPTAELGERAAVVVADALAAIAARTAVVVSGPRTGAVAARATRLVDLDAPPIPTAARPAGSSAGTTAATAAAVPGGAGAAAAPPASGNGPASPGGAS